MSKKDKNHYLPEIMKSKYTGINEESMPQAQTMILYEKLAISSKAFTLLETRDREGFSRSFKDSSHASVFGKKFTKKSRHKAAYRKAARICRKRRLNLVQTGLIYIIYDVVATIDFGCEGFATKG